MLPRRSNPKYGALPRGNGARAGSTLICGRQGLGLAATVADEAACSVLTMQLEQMMIEIAETDIRPSPSARGPSLTSSAKARTGRGAPSKRPRRSPRRHDCSCGQGWLPIHHGGPQIADKEEALL